MFYRKGELSNAGIDRGWPHQVALNADLCMGHHYKTVHFFCEAEQLSLCKRGHTFYRGRACARAAVHGAVRW